MGKKKIPMEFIADSRKRKLCFDKRQHGLIKKAMELCRLAQADVGLIIVSEETHSLVEFWSTDKAEFIQRYQALAPTPHYDFTPADYELEISNALALKPFPGHSGQQPQQQLQQPAEERPLKRARLNVEEDAVSICTDSSHVSTLINDDSSVDVDFRYPTSLEGSMAELCDINDSLGKLCDSVLSCDGSTPSSPTSSSCQFSPPPMSDEDLDLPNSNLGNLGELDVAGLLSYIGKIEPSCGEGLGINSNNAQSKNDVEGRNMGGPIGWGRENVGMPLTVGSSNGYV